MSLPCGKLKVYTGLQVFGEQVILAEFRQLVYTPKFSVVTPISFLHKLLFA